MTAKEKKVVRNLITLSMDAYLELKDIHVMYGSGQTEKDRKLGVAIRKAREISFEK